MGTNPTPPLLHQSLPYKFTYTLVGSCPFLVKQVEFQKMVRLVLSPPKSVDLIQQLLPNQTDLNLQSWSLDMVEQ
jgi:hypothetical protein